MRAGSVFKSVTLDVATIAPGPTSQSLRGLPLHIHEGRGIEEA